MIQNEEIGAASLLLAKAIAEREEPLRVEGIAPQKMVDGLTAITADLYLCIDPDELELLH